MSHERCVTVKVSRLLLDSYGLPEGASLVQRYDTARFRCGDEWSNKLAEYVSVSTLFAMETLAAGLVDQIAKGVSSTERSSSPEETKVAETDAADSADRRYKRKVTLTYLKSQLSEEERERFTVLREDRACLARTSARLIDIGTAMLALSRSLQMADQSESRVHPLPELPLRVPGQLKPTFSQLGESGARFTEILDSVVRSEGSEGEKEQLLAHRLAVLFESQAHVPDETMSQAWRPRLNLTERRTETQEGSPPAEVVAETPSRHTHPLLRAAPSSAAPSATTPSSADRILSVIRRGGITDGQGIMRAHRDVAQRLADRALEDARGCGHSRSEPSSPV